MEMIYLKKNVFLPNFISQTGTKEKLSFADWNETNAQVCWKFPGQGITTQLLIILPKITVLNLFINFFKKMGGFNDSTPRPTMKTAEGMEEGIAAQSQQQNMQRFR